MVFMLPFLFVLLLLTGCTPPKPEPLAPTFQDVKPILQNKCMFCHGPDFKPHGHNTNWLDESIVKERLDVLKERIIKRHMPMGNSLNTEEYETIKRYLDKQIEAKNDDDLLFMILVIGGSQ